MYWKRVNVYIYIYIYIHSFSISVHYLRGATMNLLEPCLFNKLELFNYISLTKNIAMVYFFLSLNENFKNVKRIDFAFYIIMTSRTVILNAWFYFHKKESISKLCSLWVVNLKKRKKFFSFFLIRRCYEITFGDILTLWILTSWRAYPYVQ